MSNHILERSDSALLPEPQPAPSVISQYIGEVVYIFAFDVAHDMTRTPVMELLGQPVAVFDVDSSRRGPRHLFFYRPQLIHLPPLERFGPQGMVRIERTVKLFSIGALSITVRVPFTVERLADLVAYHQLEFSNGSLTQEVVQLAEVIRQELKSHYIKPVATLADEEAYTVFCIESPLTMTDGMVMNTERWWRTHRRDVAGLLTEEDDPQRLSRQEAKESTWRYLTYYQHDLVVVDWDAALIVDERRQFAETLHILELANLQLAEFEAYDRMLDQSLERAYRDLEGSAFRSRTQMLKDLRELRVDLARFNDEVSNITKFLGDWHLARLYQQAYARFHLADWHQAIEEKLKTLDDLYEMLQHAQTNRIMMVLELLIVLLFIADIAMLFFRNH